MENRAPGRICQGRKDAVQVSRPHMINHTVEYYSAAFCLSKNGWLKKCQKEGLSGTTGFVALCPHRLDHFFRHSHFLCHVAVLYLSSGTWSGVNSKKL